MSLHIKEMEKIILILLLFLTSCENKEKTIACSKFEADRDIDIYINAEYDQIKSISVFQTYTLASDLFQYEERLNLLKNQLDDTYYFEDNKLIRRQDYLIEDDYSLNKTIEYLKKDKFACE